MFKKLFLGTSLCFFAGASAAADLRLMTEEYPPYNFQEGARISGLGADQIFAIMDRANLTYEVELTRWSRAIGSARNKPATCVFSTFRTPDREADFEWIGPLSEDRSLLIKTADSDITLNSIDDAASYSVGTQTGEFTVGILQDAGIANVEQAPSMADALKKLLAGRNDLMAVPELYFFELQEQGVPVVPALTLPALQVALACNPETDPDHLDAMRDAMAQIIEDGTQDTILARYQ
ncbi:MAG: transporter substrate-binding domain-containing protein [Pseudomonadota bacterium]